MVTAAEQIYVIGGTGNVGTAAIKELLRNKVQVTVYARSPAKAQNLFGNDPNLTVVEGDLDNLKPFEETITGHMRLFLLINTDFQNLAKYKTNIAQKAYASGVKQIVHISSISTTFPWRSSYIGEVHRQSEEGIVSIPNRGAYVTLRPARFMSNLLWLEINSIKFANAIIDTVDPGTEQHWISTNDIGLAAANILQEPIEKHSDGVYEMIGDVVSLTDRAELLTRVLGRKITYVRSTPEDSYKNMIEKAGLPHIMATDLLLDLPIPAKVSPVLSILLKRQPETLSQWLEANKSALL
ncbi:hypothetical protein BJV82DRAFT_573156 [Fennellomyces sp. T-0311]|nr:hypothetical protein BJV82DRAFT_573156 [Fennellomyces sp. T-0311]